MKLRIKIDLVAFLTYNTLTIISFSNLSNNVNFSETYANATSIRLVISTLSKTCVIEYNGQSLTLTGDDIKSISADQTYIIFDGETTATNTTLQRLLDNGIISLDIEGLTSVFLYKQNCENDQLNKTLTSIGIEQGKFKNIIAVKSLTLDWHNYQFNFNYVYIPLIHRYYYVDSVEMVTKEISRLHLREDVLMSWKALIKQQNALVTRYENAPNNLIVDERLPLESLKTIEYLSAVDTTTESLVNITLKGNFESTDVNIFFSCMDGPMARQDSVSAPDDNLPALSPNISPRSNMYLINIGQLSKLLTGLKNKSNLVTFVNTLMFLPFDPKVVFSVGVQSDYLGIGLQTHYVLAEDGDFYDISHFPAGVDAEYVYQIYLGASPYLIAKDFTFPTINDEWNEREPYTYYEIFIAFVGWVKVDIQQVAGKRLLIYYSLDLQTGNATAYLYNKSDGVILYSTNCQLGIKIDVSASNALELSRERQSNQLNTLIGLIASAFSIGVGIASENPVAIAGGVLSAGKTIAGAVNKDRMLFERGQTTFGSGDAGLHANLTFAIRKTYNKPINIDTAVYKRMQGLPYNQYTALSSLTGYVEVGDIHFDLMGYDIFQDEVTEIVSLLKNGVIM